MQCTIVSPIISNEIIKLITELFELNRETLKEAFIRKNKHEPSAEEFATLKYNLTDIPDEPCALRDIFYSVHESLHDFGVEYPSWFIQDVSWAILLRILNNPEQFPATQTVKSFLKKLSTVA